MRREHRTPARVVDQRGRALVDGAEELSPTERPVLMEALANSDRFHRDTGLGSIFHPGKISFREVSAVESLHVIIDGSRVSAHVDDISPLRRRRDGSIGYSVFRVLAHNVSGALGQLRRLVRGSRGEHRCNLECEVVWVDDGAADAAADQAAATDACGGDTGAKAPAPAPTSSAT